MEDDPALISIVEAVLDEVGPGISLQWTASAEGAIALLKDPNVGPEIGLVIADVFLEGAGTGLDLLEYCRTHQPHLPVIVTSALPVEKFFAALGRDQIAPPFLAKPFGLTDLRGMLAGVLEYSRKKAG